MVQGLTKYKVQIVYSTQIKIAEGHKKEKYEYKKKSH
jgi:hypothetical protein